VCDNNQLTTLPNLPAELTYLYCHDNQLTALPDLPTTLTSLHCDNNNLTALPDLPAGLRRLFCENNQLTSLPDLPTGLRVFLCNNNPFPPELQEIIETYRDNLPQLIISVNYYNAEKRRRANLRQAGRTYKAIRNANMPNNVLGVVGHYATGKKPSYGLNKTLENLKLNYNSYGPRKQRKTMRKKRKNNRRKTRK
jgi:Leucine-rich repeat (LRR) protein